MFNKDHGKYIVIKFDLSLTNDVIDAVEGFTVTGNEYRWVQGPNRNGPLLEREYEVVDVDYAPTQNSDNLNSWQGIRHQVETSGNMLRLSRQEGDK